MSVTATHRQSEVLAMVQAHCREHGAVPSYAQIASHFGTALGVAASHVRSLRRKGYVRGRWATGRMAMNLAPSPRKTGPEWLTYFFLDSVTGRVKIGRSTRIEERKRQLESAFPCSLTVLLLLPDAEWTEMAVHRLFNADRHRGEWFHYSDAMKAFIAEQEANSRS